MKCKEGSAGMSAPNLGRTLEHQVPAMPLPPQLPGEPDRICLISRYDPPAPLSAPCACPRFSALPVSTQYAYCPI